MRGIRRDSDSDPISDCNIRINRQLFNLLWVPTPKFVIGYNGHLGASLAFERPMLMAFVNAKNILVQQGLVRENEDGRIEQI